MLLLTSSSPRADWRSCSRGGNDRYDLLPTDKGLPQMLRLAAGSRRKGAVTYEEGISEAGNPPKASTSTSNSDLQMSPRRYNR
jgi:hypothetical protein